jgi:hypothetical protein
VFFDPQNTAAEIKQMLTVRGMHMVSTISRFHRFTVIIRHQELPMWQVSGYGHTPIEAMQHARKHLPQA